MESAPQAVRCLTANTAALGLQDQVRLLAEDVLRVLKRPPDAPYDLVFMDPPYRKRLADPALRLLVQRGWLAPGAFVTAEVEKEARLSPPPELRPEVDRLLGQTRIRIWTMP